MTKRILMAAVTVLLPLLAQAQTARSYTITTVAGIAGTAGFVDGSATSAEFSSPCGIAVDSSGNVFVADAANHRVRKIAGGNVTTVAGNGTGAYTGDGGAATSASLNSPCGVAVDSSGNLYIADFNNSVVRKVTSGGTISTFAGSTSGAGFSGDGTPANASQLAFPTAVVLDSAGSLYIVDAGNHRIRKVTSGTISTVAGNGTTSRGTDGGPATSAGFNVPAGIAVDSSGNIYVADSGNHAIRFIANGIITTVAGTGTSGFSGDNGPATSATLSSPKGIAVDGSGNLFIADYNNNRIRMVSNGVITTIAGKGAGYSGDNGPATSALLRGPNGITLDSSGNVFFSDAGNEVIRKLAPSPLSVSQVISAGAFGAFTSAAPGSWIEVYGSNLATTTRSWSGSDFSGSTAPTALSGTQVSIGGLPAFVSYISPSQVNAQIPSNSPWGSQQLVVTLNGVASTALPITVNATQPGLFAPPVLNIGGKQYVGALFQDGTYALPAGAVQGITSRPAVPGDNLTLYGIGFGAVTPDTPAGQIAGGLSTLASPMQILFGTTAVTPSYQGLNPGLVGLYQFNVTVPQVAGGDAVPLTFTLGGASGTQTLYIAVAN